jgi:hypothetical protein
LKEKRLSSYGRDKFIRAADNAIFGGWSEIIADRAKQFIGYAAFRTTAASVYSFTIAMPNDYFCA